MGRQRRRGRTGGRSGGRAGSRTEGRAEGPTIERTAPAGPTAVATDGAAAANDASSGQPADATGPDGARPALWIEGLAKVLGAVEDGGCPAARTALGCRVDPDGSALFVPPEMPTLQPASLAWLRRFADATGFRLVEDRRRRDETPAAERRGAAPPAIALGLALLLRQTGLPGPAARLSAPHRHAADGPFIDVPELVAMAASAARRSKRVTVLPSRPLVDVLGGDTRPVNGYACRLDCAPARTVLSHFDAPGLRAVGYSSGRQYVVHLLLGGGAAAAPKLWVAPATLARTDARFRLFPGPDARLDFGLLYSTFYFDMTGRRPVPWWLREKAFTDTPAPRSVRTSAELALAG